MATRVGKVIPADGAYTEGHRILLEDTQFTTVGDVIHSSGGGGGGGGTLSSIGINAPIEFTTTPGLLTSDGSITIDKVGQNANTFWAAPDGTPGIPVFRLVVGNDIPLATAGSRGAMPALSGSSSDFLNGLGNWAVPPAGGGATVYSLTDGNGNSWTPQSIVGTTPTDILGLGNIPLDANSLYEIELLLFGSVTPATDGLQFKVVTPLNDEFYAGQAIFNIGNSSGVIIPIDPLTGGHQTSSSSPSLNQLATAKFFYTTVSAHSIKFQAFAETAGGTVTLYGAIAKVTKHRTGII
jgi:hypothetical protein